MSMDASISQAADAGKRVMLRTAHAAAIGIGFVSAFTAMAAEQQFPDVLTAKVRSGGTDTFDFDVTVSSPYDTEKRYADAFHVVGPDGKIYGERKLVHDHASEQPFTRDLYEVSIPASVKRVVIQARDQRFGYGGKTFEAVLPGR